MSLGRVGASGEKSISNLFASYFKSFYKNFNPTLPPQEASETLVQDLRISEEELWKAIKDMKKTGPGPDNIPATFISKCSNCLLKPLLLIFNSSLESGIFPKRWKTSYIKPIPKKGDAGNVRNYRPVSIVNAIPKLFDSLITLKLYDKLSPFIHNEQHGFSRGKSTETNLALFTEFIFSSLDKHEQVDAFYSDFSRAFDSVNHALLIRKLYNFGVRGNLLKWIELFLSERKVQVKIKNHVSDYFDASSGVPQGSHLGPLLFILFINDAKNIVANSQLYLFADDAKLVIKGKWTGNCVELQRDIDSFIGWSVRNGLDINLSKCNIITFSHYRNPYHHQYFAGFTPLTRVDRVRDLGVIIDSSLNFHAHIDSVCAKASKILGFLIRFTSDFNNCNVIIYLYKAIVLPILTYASPIWSPYTFSAQYQLEKIQHRFLRYLARKAGTPMNFQDHDYSHIATRFSIPSLKSLFKVRDAQFAFNIIKKRIKCPELSDLFKERNRRYNLREYRTFVEHTYYSNTRYFSTIPRLIRLWHSLPRSITSQVRISVFKKQVREKLFNFN